MEAFPHHYRVAFTSVPADPEVALTSAGLEVLPAAAPAEFGGPGNRWSPETLLTGAVASCYALSFRAVAEASKFTWRTLRCEVDGTLDRQERVTRFTRLALTVELEIDAAAGVERAERLLHKAEEVCLVTNSLNAEISFQAKVKAL